jgi:hypothetical protein
VIKTRIWTVIAIRLLLPRLLDTLLASVQSAFLPCYLCHFFAGFLICGSNRQSDSSGGCLSAKDSSIWGAIDKDYTGLLLCFELFCFVIFFPGSLLFGLLVVYRVGPGWVVSVSISLDPSGVRY